MTIKDVWLYTCKLYFIFVGYFFVYVYNDYITRLEALLLCTSLAIIGLIVVLYEKKAEKVRIKFTAKRKQEISKIIQELGAQLCIDYYDVACFKKSLRGVKRARSFEQKFQLKEDKEKFFLTQSGNIPFPMSIIERAKINKQFVDGLARYGYFESE